MRKGTVLNQLYQLPQTVFSVGELAQVFPQKTDDSLANSLAYYVKNKQLARLRRGIYAKPKFNTRELANKIYTPSYLSFNTVLLDAGLIFQPDSMFYSASYLSRQTEVGGRHFSYHKLQPEILANPDGVTKQGQVNLATPERAFLDTIYLWGEFHIDNLRPLNWKRVFELAPLYGQKVLIERVKEQQQDFLEKQAESESDGRTKVTSEGKAGFR